MLPKSHLQIEMVYTSISVNRLPLMRINCSAIVWIHQDDSWSQSKLRNIRAMQLKQCFQTADPTLQTVIYGI